MIEILKIYLLQFESFVKFALIESTQLILFLINKIIMNCFIECLYV